jgi:hypothetical protein
MKSKQNSFTTQDNFAYYNNYNSQSKKISKKLKIHIIIVLINVFIGFIVVGTISAGDELSSTINSLLKKSDKLENYKENFDSMSNKEKELIKKEILGK